MKTLLTLFALLLPAALSAQGEASVPEKSPQELARELTEKYFSTKRIAEKHRAMQVDNNRRFLEELIKARPCIPESILEKAGEIGEFPEAVFRERFVGKIMDKLNAADIRLLVDFYQTPLGQFFIEWAMRHDGDYSSVVPVEDREDAEILQLYEEVLRKEQDVMFVLSSEGALLTEEEEKADKARVRADVAALAQPYLDERGQCK